ncbi:MAG TPA: glycosyltransferase 87 family protein, partial [Solirubrobacterales bacterium]|nr:glycosyltransferase 87 family protein [Solirubrobacterales bacterium]
MLPFAGVVLASIWLVSRITSTGDWGYDSWKAVGPLTHGHVGDYFTAKLLMGPLPPLLEAPFAAIPHGDFLTVYQWACIPPLLVAGACGLYVAAVAGRRGASRLTQVLLASLFLVNPLTTAALGAGHPEEVLTAALAVAAVAAAGEGRNRRAAVLLGLALASKQWAVIAILPVLMALPDRRLRVAGIAAGIAIVLTLPGFLAAPGGFSDVHSVAAQTGRVVTPLNVWFPISPEVAEVVGQGPATTVAHVRRPPEVVSALSHPLIVLLAFALPLALAFKRRSFALGASEAMALLALLALLRCALDCLDNVYYHLPLLLALIGWDALAARGLPLRTLLGAAAAFVFVHWSLNLDDAADVVAFNYGYLALVIPAGVAIGLSLLQKPEFSLDEVQISG